MYVHRCSSKSYSKYLYPSSLVLNVRNIHVPTQTITPHTSSHSAPSHTVLTPPLTHLPSHSLSHSSHSPTPSSYPPPTHLTPPSPLPTPALLQQCSEPPDLSLQLEHVACGVLVDYGLHREQIGKQQQMCKQDHTTQTLCTMETRTVNTNKHIKPCTYSVVCVRAYTCTYINVTCVRVCACSGVGVLFRLTIGAST